MELQRIHALPLHLANQIAAGEVVERPASVLKELVENSIDAGASQIDIQIEGAGNQLIRVSDNGKGIHPDDLALALSRHATSKLHSSEQLSHIDSLGFRGEALPSIASVSRLTLTSRPDGQDCGWQITTDDQQPMPAAHPFGTSVSVAELFFNLPARRRFLRSDKTELHHLSTTLNRLALSRFDVGFNCQFGDNTSLRLPAITDPAQASQRVAKICGRAFVNEAVFLEQQYQDIKLEGWVGKSSAHRAQTDVQYFFINGRVIRDRIINHAIRQAYGESLPVGRQPAYVLYLTLPLDRVDVNVHPTKHEVRFRDARLVHGLITRAVEEALQQENDEQQSVQTSLPLPETMPSAISEAPQPYHATELKSRRDSTTTIPTASNAGLTILHQRYLILQQPEPMLFDLQQAELALRRRQFTDAVNNASLSSRTVLVPVSLPMTAEDLALIARQQALLKQFALELQTVGSVVTIKRIPYLLSQVDLQHIPPAVVGALQQDDKAEALARVLMDLMPTIPVGSTEQAKQILQQLSGAQLDNAPWCRKLDQATLTGLFSV